MSVVFRDDILRRDSEISGENLRKESLFVCFPFLWLPGKKQSRKGELYLGPQFQRAIVHYGECMGWVVVSILVSLKKQKYYGNMFLF